MRGIRMLAFVLSVTGCAVEPPHPIPVSVPPPPRLVPPPIISGFGDWHAAGGVPRPRRHSGIDIRVPIGTPVLAAAVGTVLRVGTQPLAGKLIVVGHADDVATVYFHLSEIRVVAGQTVWRGEMIGRAGISGNATTPHLHFGVCRRQGGQCSNRMDDAWEDPTAYWVDRAPCFVPGRPLPNDPIRFTYPVPCSG